MKHKSLPESEITEAINQLTEVGYYVIKSYIPERELVELKNKAVSLYNENSSLGIKQDMPKGIQKVIKSDRLVNNVIAYDDTFLDIATSGEHLKIYQHFLNDPFYGLIPDNDANFILGQANLREGASQLPFHVDTRMVTPGPATWSMQGIIALSEKNNKTGGLRVRPGSHLLGAFPDSSLDYEDAIDIDLAPGDMAIFCSQLHHGTHPSLESKEPGWSFNLTYRAWWAKPQFNFSSMLGQTRLRRLTPNQQLLLGACSQPPSAPNASPSIREGYSSLQQQKEDR